LQGFTLRIAEIEGLGLLRKNCFHMCSATRCCCWFVNRLSKRLLSLDFCHVNTNVGCARPGFQI